MRRPSPFSITFADLLTQCLCFMALWPVLSARSASKADVRGDSAPSAVSGETGDADGEFAFPRFSPLADAPASEPGRATIRIPLPDLFERGSTALRPGIEARIEEAARVASYDLAGRAELRVMAEASGSRDGGDRAGDLALALARADAVAAAIARAGDVPRRRLAIAGTRGDGDGAVLVISFPGESGETTQNAERREEAGAGDETTRDLQTTVENDKRE